MFRSLFNRTPNKTLPAVANLTLGRTFTVDVVERKLIPEDALLVAPESDLQIVAQGIVDLGEQSFLHRFYPNDDRFLLQVQGGDGHKDTRIDEIVLWYAFDVRYLSKNEDWNKLKTAIRKASFALPSGTETTEYSRVWFDHTPEDEAPMGYIEDIHDTDGAETSNKIYQTAMLFGRGLSDGTDEMLLVNLEEPEDGERAASFLIGRAIPQHALLT
mgnify:FL=1